MFRVAFTKNINMTEQVKFFEKPKEGESWDVAIVGSGPSAMTAGIYTTRGAASTLMIAGDKWGGQLMLTTEVDNFPGFPEGIQGPELMQNMRSQVERFGAEIIDRRAVEVNVDGKPFTIKTSEEEYKANSIIIATGADTRWLGVPGEEKLRGRGVSSCAPCDAPFFKDKKVAVIGGGDAAMEEALVLTKYASEVYLIHRRDSFKASQAMQQKVLNSDKISVIWDTEVREFLGDQKLEKLKLFNNKSNEESEMDFQGAFVAIGHVPSTEIFKGKVNLDEKGYVTRSNHEKYKMLTDIEGVYVAGDVHDYHYRQAITASAYGCMAAMEVLKYLEKDGPAY